MQRSEIGAHDRAAELPCAGGNNGKSGIVAPTVHHRHAGFYNASLFAGDLFHRVAEYAHMVERDTGDDRYERSFYNICRIQTPAHADFKHNDIAPVQPEIEKGKRGDELEFGGLVLHR